MEIIIMGMQKSGKSSIKRVVFEKMSPHESVFNETTTNIESLQVDSLGYTQLNISEFPASFNYSKATPNDLSHFTNSTIIIYVLDSQDCTNSPYEYFRENILPILVKNPNISLNVFTHKTDSVNANPNDLVKQKGEIQTRFNDIIEKEVPGALTSFYSTSIYDYSLFEAFSKIFQKTLQQNSLLGSLLDYLTLNCQFDKSYLFDVFNKIYLAVDSSPMEEQTYEICSDMIDVVLDMSGIYGDENNNDSYFDENSMSSIKIENTEREVKNVLYLRFIDSNLALVTVVPEGNFEHPSLLDHNISVLRECVKKILKK